MMDLIFTVIQNLFCCPRIRSNIKLCETYWRLLRNPKQQYKILSFTSGVAGEEGRENQLFTACNCGSLKCCGQCQCQHEFLYLVSGTSYSGGFVLKSHTHQKYMTMGLFRLSCQVNRQYILDFFLVPSGRSPGSPRTLKAEKLHKVDRDPTEHHCTSPTILNTRTFLRSFTVLRD